MRLGYTLGDVACELSTYESYLKCPDPYEFVKPMVRFYEKFVTRKEDITFVPYENLSFTSNSSTNKSLLDALANGTIDAYINGLVVTAKRLEFLSFTTPYAFNRICFYIKRPETVHSADQPLFFLTPFAIHTWLLIMMTLVLMQLLSYITGTSYTHRTHAHIFLAFKGISCILLLAEGLMAASYLAALREILIEYGDLKPPFGNINDNGSQPCT